MIKRKVFVGMSGGVDSSVSAALLLQQGFKVVGAFIKGWDLPRLDGESRRERHHCTWRDERRDAMRVAAHLDIPLITVDFSAEYKQMVVDYLIREYRAGRTPNPDVMCNKEIKFGLFFDWARRRGAEYIATGHYAQVKNSRLLAAKDKNKDQTYFLWTLTPEHLNHTLFPVGGYLKSEVRQLAKRFKLPTAEKKDSQGICFLGQVDMTEFLEKYLPKKSGAVVNETGEIIGEHQGVQFYTLGQRHGFIISTNNSQARPYYIVAKDVKKNTLTVAFAPPATRTPVVLSEINWTTGAAPSDTKTYQARIRHRGELLPCRIKFLTNNQLELQFLGLSFLVAPGQSIVLYDGQHCLGGGIVEG